MFFTNSKKLTIPTPDSALPGRDTPINVTGQHAVLKRPLVAPFPDNTQQLMVGLGCFWGAEKRFWTLDGVYTTAVGYSAGHTPNPTYEEVCSGETGHNEVVLIVFWPDQISAASLLTCFWESHDPTQGMAQGNDRGTQYRSGIYCTNSEQLALAKASLAHYQQALNQSLGDRAQAITTEIQAAGAFYYAEDYHQQYLAKNPNGYCGLGGLPVAFP